MNACLRSALTLLSILLGVALSAEAQLSGPPTATCHVTDGKFTACPNGQTEWFDVRPLAFPSTNSFLYVNQDASHSFLYLLYDFPFRTAALAPADSVRVSFDTVSQDSGTPGLEKYDIDIFANGQIQVLENGQPTPPGRIAGAAGFGTSPNSPTPHLIAELQVPLTPGPPTAYSPDPLFWNATVPPPPNPPPPPPPDPCPTDPGKTYNRCVKAELNNAQANAAEMAMAVGLAAGLCSSVGALACAPLEPVMLITAAVWTATSIELNRKLNADPPGLDFTVPPDPNFTVISQPATYSLSLPTFGLTAQEAAAFNAFAVNAQQLIALEQAETKALARVEGASLAGNTVWVNNQMQAARKFAGQAGPLLAQLPVLQSNIGAAIKAAGTQFTFTPSDFQTFLTEINPNSPPSEPQQQFAQARQAVIQQLGISTADQALFLPLLSSVDPQAVETLGAGAFPQFLSDPLTGTVFKQLGTDLIQNAPSLTSLTPSFQFTLPGDYVAGGVGLRGGTAPSYGPPPTTGPINISTIPAGATVVKAFLYWGMLDNGLEPSLGKLNLNGNPLTGSLIGSGPDTCWGRTSSFTFRADVTSLVAGNGTYTLSGFATGGNILSEGASLVVIYQLVGAPTKTVILADGNISIPQGTATGTASFSGFTASGPVSATTTFIVGDGQLQQGFTTTATFTGNLGTLTFPGVFGANNGPLWDTDTFNVSSVIGVGNSSDSATVRLIQDCVLWSAQAFSISSAPVTSSVTATAAIVQANVGGDTVADLRGLASTDAPTLQDQIQLIVQSRVIQNPSTSATQLTTQLVNSLPPTILPPNQAANIINAVVNLVVTPPAPLDTLPPTTTATPSPGPNANGWNNASVTVAFNSVDNTGGSGVKQITIALSGAQTGTTVAPGGTASLTISAEGVTTVTYFGTDNAGNQEAAKTFTVRIDRTPPTATATIAPAPNNNGWNNTSATVTFTGADQLSGLASCTAPVTLTMEGAGQSVSGTCTDKAGNVSSPATAVVNIDETPPSFSGLPAPGSCTLWPPNHKLVQVATIAAGDNLAGVASFDVTVASNEPPDAGDPDVVITGTGLQPRVVQLISERLGTGTGRIYTITATATDVAGNTKTSTATCTVPHDQGK